MLSYGAVQRVYGICLDKATLWLNDNAYAVSPQNVVCCLKKDIAGDNIVEATVTLHFWDWPERHGSPERIDILASMIETISLETGACTKATLRVNYFRIEGKKASLTESLHYDYECPPDTKHPICHVQNSNDLLDKRPESFGRKRKLEPIKLGNRCQNVRIPSAFVNLPGLFAILAADHMSEPHWREFMDHCLVHFRKIPAMAEHAVVDQVKEGLCAWNWYKM